jgi:uncharacterized protein (TIGR00255 family)
MIYSMTGYGRAAAANDTVRVEVEIKTLNSRYTEVFARLPAHYFEQELHLRHLLTQRLVRGKITLQLTVESISDGLPAPAGLDLSRVEQLYRRLDALRQQLGLAEPLRLEGVLALPDLASVVSTEVDPAEWALVQAAVEEAAEAVIESRRREGQLLAQELAEQVTRLLELLSRIEAWEADRKEQFRQRLRQAAADLADAISVSEERYHQELIYYLEKYDIREEKVRIGVHAQAFLETLHAPEAAHGRRLGFLAQELHREINTLGVKAYDPRIQEVVLRLKEIVEQLKEQLMNVV